METKDNIISKKNTFGWLRPILRQSRWVIIAILAAGLISYDVLEYNEIKVLDILLSNVPKGSLFSPNPELLRTKETRDLMSFRLGQANAAMLSLLICIAYFGMLKMFKFLTATTFLAVIIIFPSMWLTTRITVPDSALFNFLLSFLISFGMSLAIVAGLILAQKQWGHRWHPLTV